MKRQEMVMVNETNDWTKINLEDYDFDNVALQEAQYIFEYSTVAFDEISGELKDRVDEFNELYKTNATIDPDTYGVKVEKSKLFDFIFYVLWSEYSGQNEDLDEDTFKMYCKTDPVVQKIIAEKVGKKLWY